MVGPILKFLRMSGYIAFQLGIAPVHLRTLALTLTDLSGEKDQNMIFEKSLLPFLLTGREAFKGLDTLVVKLRGVNHSGLMGQPKV